MAIMNSLSRSRVLRSAGLAAAFLALPASVARADDPSAAGAATAPEPSADPRYQTVVTALRLPRPLRDVPAAVTVIARDEIDRTAALGADELVRTAPAAGTFRRTPALTADPSAQGLNLRGVAPSAVSRALVLYDGVPLNDPFGGWVYWRALPRLGLDRIEVVPGGSSSLYGNYGLGGTVQLVGRPIDDRIEADLAYGSRATPQLALHGGARGPVVAASLDIEALQTDGYIPVAAAQRGAIDREATSRHGAAVARLELQVDPAWSLAARVSGFTEDQNGGTAYTTAQVRTAGAALSAVRAASAGTLTLAAHGSLERFNQDRARVAPGRGTEQLAATQEVPSSGQGATVTYASAPLAWQGLHTLLVGADFRRVEGQADEILYAPGDPGAPAPPPNHRSSGGEQRFAGLFIDELYAPHPKLEVSAGVRLDGLFAERRTLEANPRLGLLVRPSPSTRLRASAYRSFRAPTLNELYRPFQVGTILTAANPALAPEHLLGGDVGGQLLLGGAGSLQLGAFWNVLEDPIVNATLLQARADGATRQRQNLGRARIRGLEASLDVRPTAYLMASVSYTLVDARVTAAADPDLVGKRLPQDPVHRGRAALAVTHPRFQATVALRLQGAQFEDDLNRLGMGGHALVDLSAAVPIGRGFSWIAAVENLLDQDYLVGRAGVDTVGPPLMAWTGLRLRAAPGSSPR
jgi:iron complex outermembrane receptor protein